MAEQMKNDDVVTTYKYVPYDKRKLSYANTFSNPFKVFAIRTIEWMTGKIPLLRRIRRAEKLGVESGQAFWQMCFKVMGIDILTPDEQIARIPKTGPLVVVANHPQGMVDGMLLAELIGRVRTDYKVLTRNLLAGVEEVEEFMIPVAFPHEENAIKQNINMRKQAMAQLKAGGVIILFPSGQVATSRTFFGPIVEHDWNPFTAKMILKSGADVLPVFFPGRNTRFYQIANLVSPTLRQGLLLHEVCKVLDKPQCPHIGETLKAEECAEWSSDPRGFMAWLRGKTLAVNPNA